jgi:D-psicose/D-tagatose/L-ribulose 3-epimerase
MTGSEWPSLSISNIAWPADADTAALDLVAELGFQGVEIAPGKVFGDIATASLDEVRTYRDRLEARGLGVPALQAIFHGVSGAHLFNSEATRARMGEHLRRVAAVAGALGAGACVFGAPALRDPGPLPLDEALAVATRFFRDIAPAFAAQRVALCFEANPPLYGCRFVTATEDAFDLVNSIDAPGIALQLDTGTMFVNGEDPSIIARVFSRIGHVHVSEPGLAPIGSSRVDHKPIATALDDINYVGWVSIEMKTTSDWQSAVRSAHEIVQPLYQAHRR